MFETNGTNTILYCLHRRETVRFYRDDFELPISLENDRFVEFQLSENSFLGIANSARATVKNVGGQGITLAWKVANLEPLKTKLESAGIKTTEIRKK